MFPISGFLQIPPHDGHPCLRLYPSHYRADSGLAPVRKRAPPGAPQKGCRRIIKIDDRAAPLFRKNHLISLNRFRRVAFNRAQVEIHRVLGYLQQFCDMLHGIFHIKHTLLIEYFNNRAVV